MQKKIIAIFGGSFNPPINSHVLLAKEILRRCTKIEKLIFVPVSTKYCKHGLVQDIDRYNMLKLICNKEDKLEVSDIELKAKEQLYTIQTLDLFKQKYSNYDIYFIMGSDNLKEIETWKEPQRILTDYKVIILERDNDNLEEIVNNNQFLKANRQSLIKIDGINKIYLSSSMIREKIKKGESIKGLIDEDVLSYIENKNLF